MTYFKKQLDGGPAIWCEDGLVAIFELEEERDLFLNSLSLLTDVKYSIENCKANSGAVFLGDKLESKIKETK